MSTDHSLLMGFEAKERSLPKEESMPIVFVLQKLFYHLPFTQYSGSSALSVLQKLSLKIHSEEATY